MIIEAEVRQEHCNMSDPTDTQYIVTMRIEGHRVVVPQVFLMLDNDPSISSGVISTAEACRVLNAYLNEIVFATDLDEVIAFRDFVCRHKNEFARGGTLITPCAY